MQYGMIGYSVPHSVFPAGYHDESIRRTPTQRYLELYRKGLAASPKARRKKAA